MGAGGLSPWEKWTAVSESDTLVIHVKEQAEMVQVSVAGAVCAAGTMELRTALVAVLENEPPRILVDCRDVSYVSSSGIGMLVSLLKRCHHDGVGFALCGLNEDIREIFSLTRLDQVFTILEKAEDWTTTSL